MEFGKTLNDEGSKCQKNTLEDEGKTITGKAAFFFFWEMRLQKVMRQKAILTFPLHVKKKKKEQKK